MSNTTPDTSKNQIRRDRARKALEYYHKDCLGESGPSLDPEALRDIVVDLMHLCAFQAKDKDDVEYGFDNVLESARENYERESAGKD